MKCPECERRGLPSIVYVAAATRTAAYSAPCYDDAGTYHASDANTTTTEYYCSWGHRWAAKDTGEVTHGKPT